MDGSGAQAAPETLAPTAVAQRLQLLADVLALEFSQSMASEQCAATLRRMLPGLQYLSVAVTNPAQPGSIVASANCAVPGPTILHLHDATSSAAGLALARGEPLQAMLEVGGPASAHAWTDVRQMAAAAPGVTHLLCVPFGASLGGSTGSAAPSCEFHGSNSGALLFGFSGPPAIDDRRGAMLASLARSLPAPMARLSGDALAFVNFATGTVARCSCCCDGGGEEGDADVQPGSPCRDGRRSRDGGGAGPSQALRVPDAPAGFAAAAAEDESPGPSSQGPGLKTGSSRAASAAAAAQAGWSGPDARPRPGRRLFSKAVLSAAGEAGGATSQHLLSLAFRSPLVEREYGEWAARFHHKADILFSLLLATALLIVSCVRPHKQAEVYPPASLAVGMLLPLAVCWHVGAQSAAWRERLVAGVRLYLVALVTLVSLRAHQVHLTPDRAQQWGTFWMLTGAESLCVTALGLPIRMRAHLPLQLAALCAVLWHTPRMCSKCYPDSEAGACFRSSAAMATLCGFLLPSLCLRQLEQRSRAVFARQLRAAAARVA